MKENHKLAFIDPFDPLPIQKYSNEINISWAPPRGQWLWLYGSVTHLLLALGKQKSKVRARNQWRFPSLRSQPGNWSWRLCHVSLPSKLTAEQPEDLRAEPLDGPTVALPSKWEGNAHLPIISQSPRTKGKQGKLDKVDRSHDVSIRNWRDWENKSGQIDI